MGIVFGISIAIVTLPIAWFAAVVGPNANFNTGRSDGRAALIVLIAGEAIAALLIVSHFYPLSW